MACRLFALCATVLVVGLSYGAPTTVAEVYWRTVLPDIPMPEAILELMHPDNNVQYEPKAQEKPLAGKDIAPFRYNYNRGSGLNQVPSAAIAQVSKAPMGNLFNYRYHKNVAMARGKRTMANKARTPFDYSYRGSKREPSIAPFRYRYTSSNQNKAQSAAMERSKSQNEIATTVFFLEEALRIGNNLTFYFPPVTSNLALLPRHIAESIPFSMSELTEILAMFSMAPDSDDAANVRSTLQSCEPSSVSQESTFCASSLESMIELAMSALQTRDITVKMSTVPKAGAPLQQYALRTVQAMKGSDFVACHDEAYPYTVYRCHTTGLARAYVLEMAGELGNMVAVAAVCHTDTSRWNPAHVAFELLKVKPGTVPVCHIMPYGHMLWARNENRSSG